VPNLLCCVSACCVVCLHGAGTEAALPLASGMAAICSTLLMLLKTGDHMLIQVSQSCVQQLHSQQAVSRAAVGWRLLQCARRRCRLLYSVTCGQWQAGRVRSAPNSDDSSRRLASKINSNSVCWRGISQTSLLCLPLILGLCCVHSGHCAGSCLWRHL
jgi:hypothetical protein